MDQEAFRALLSAPSAAGTSDRTKKSTRGGRPAWGASSSRPERNQSDQPSESKPASSLKPRKFNSKNDESGQKKAKESESGYRDRALERRQGKDGDFAEAESLLENFQARVAAAGDQVDRELLEQQTKYLGGDERHTILVKGLDHALLERRKAELSAGGKLGQVTDDDLEAAFEETQRQEPNQLDDELPSSKRKSSGKISQRDELLARLKSSRSNGSASVPEDLVVVEKLKTVGKFKPIGSAEKTPSEIQEQERKERKKRKKEKKEKKQQKTTKVDAVRSSPKATKPNDPSDPSAHSKAFPNRKPSISSTATPNPVTSLSPKNLGSRSLENHPLPGPSNPVEVKSVPPPVSAKETISQALPPLTQTDEVDDDVDIFGDVGEYKPFGDDSSESGDEDLPIRSSPPALPEASSSNGAVKRKNYFEDDPVSDGESPEVREPIPTPGASLDRSQRSTEVAQLEDDAPEQEEEASQPGPLTRLEGLSGSADIKSLLAADAAQEREEKRKAKKLKKSETVKVLSDKDKLNRDVMEMDRYLQKKNVKPALEPES